MCFGFNVGSRGVFGNGSGIGIVGLVIMIPMAFGNAWQVMVAVGQACKQFIRMSLVPVNSPVYERDLEASWLAESRA